MSLIAISVLLLRIFDYCSADTCLCNGGKIYEYCSNKTRSASCNRWKCYERVSFE